VRGFTKGREKFRMGRYSDRKIRSSLKRTRCWHKKTLNHELGWIRGCDVKQEHNSERGGKKEPQRLT